MSMPFLVTPVAIALITIGVLTVSPDVGADVDPYRLYLADRGAIPWQSLSREEQDALQRYRRNWDSYSSGRQQRMRQGAQRFLELPPDKRQQVEQKRQEYERLSPQERKRLREEYRRRDD